MPMKILRNRTRGLSEEPVYIIDTLEDLAAYFDRLASDQQVVVDMYRTDRVAKRVNGRFMGSKPKRLDDKYHHAVSRVQTWKDAAAILRKSKLEPTNIEQTELNL